MTNEIDLDRSAANLGYERIEWTVNEDGEGYYVGFGSSNPTDRTRDCPDGYFVALNDAELAKLVEMARDDPKCK